jgi:L-ascorbate metabolism protein UlaG (beta-lactamase superfamily)
MRSHLAARRKRLTGLASLGSWAVKTAPRFWDEYSRERRRPVLPSPFEPSPGNWPDRGLHAAWLGHSTVLLKIDGVTILTDPVFSTRVGIGLGPVTVGLKRMVAPALDIHALPEIDVILLSHAHMDHFDLPSLRRLANRETTVITAARTADLLCGRRYAAVREVGWGGTIRLGPLEVRAFQVNHWGARMRSDSYRGFNGYTIEIGGYRVLFGGDTAMTNVFRSLRTSRPFDLAIMPVGAYNPWIHYHCTPEQAWQMAEDAGFEHFLPVHHQTFRLSREPYSEPIERVYAAAGQHTDRVAMSAIGQDFHLT